MKIAALAAAVVGVGLALAGPSATLAQTAGGASDPAPEATKRLFVITYSAGPAWKPGQPFEQQGLTPHFYYWRDLFAAGDIFAAGPLGTQDGLVIFHAADQAAADRLIADDPAVAGGILVGVARPYSPPFLSPGPLVRTRP